MALSGTTTYTQNRDQIIRSAYELIGIAVDGEALNADDINVAQNALNVMVKAWQAHGLNLWKRGSLSIPLTANTTTYTVGSSGTVTTTRPLRVLECVREDTNNVSTIMTRLTLQEYENLPNKTTTGTPVNYFFDPTLTNSTFKFWPVPDANAASEYTIKLKVQVPISDLTSGTDDVDFPQEWLEALIYGLAVRLAPRSSLDLRERQLLKLESKEILDLALSFDVEEESIYFQPNYQGMR